MRAPGRQVEMICTLPKLRADATQQVARFRSQAAGLIIRRIGPECFRLVACAMLHLVAVPRVRLRRCCLPGPPRPGKPKARQVMRIPMVLLVRWKLLKSVADCGQGRTSPARAEPRQIFGARRRVDRKRQPPLGCTGVGPNGEQRKSQRLRRHARTCSAANWATGYVQSVTDVAGSSECDERAQPPPKCHARVFRRAQPVNCSGNVK